LRTSSSVKAHDCRNKVIGDTFPQRPNANFSIDFKRVSSELERLHLMREKVIADAFDALENTYASLAQILLMHAGDRRKAAGWMCLRQSAFDGRNGYDVLAEGDSAKVWDQIEQNIFRNN
jgi:hypothetical protein